MIKILITENQLKTLLQEKFEILPDHLLPNNDIEEFLNDDNFSSEILNNPYKSYYIKQLDKIKSEFMNFLNSESIANKSPASIITIINQWKNVIKKMRLVIDPKITFANNVNRNNTYVIARANWVDNNGKHFRKFNVNIGNKKNIKLHINFMTDLSNKFTDMMWKHFKDEYNYEA